MPRAAKKWQFSCFLDWQKARAALQAPPRQRRAAPPQVAEQGRGCKSRIQCPYLLRNRAWRWRLALSKDFV